MLTGYGYLNQVDWWALGVVLYECVYGERPFDGETVEEVEEKIQHDFIELSPISTTSKGVSRDVSRHCLQVMRGFLERDRFHRLCCRDGEEGWPSLQQIPWFEGIEWEKVKVKQHDTGYLPPSSNGSTLSSKVFSSSFFRVKISKNNNSRVQ